MTRLPSDAAVDAAAQVLRVDDGRWVLAGPLTIGNVVHVLAASVDVPLPPTGRVDLKDVDPVDSAGVDLLVEGNRKSAVEGRCVSFGNVRPSMK